MLTQVDLITGFLGAGKTTFIRGYARYLQKKGFSFRIIENDFGSVGTDAMELQQERLPVSEISGGCICCTLKLKFNNTLLELAGKVDRIVVEPSGIYNLDEFFNLMKNEDMRKVCRIGSVVTIVDPKSLLDLDETSAAVLSSELFGSGRVIWSKAEECSSEELEKAANMLSVLMEDGTGDSGLTLPIDPVPTMKMTDEDFERVMNSTPVFRNHAGCTMNHSFYYGKDFFYPVKAPSKQALLQAFRELLKDRDCGRVLRIKGFAFLQTGETCSVNYTPGRLEIEPTPFEMRPVINVIGYDISHRAIATYLKVR